MTRSSPASAWSRRALVRSSIAEMFGVSSMYIGASDSAFIAGAIRAKSSSSRKPRAQALRVDVGDARQQAQDELLLAHLEAEHADALALLDRGVLGDVEREARLADRRPGGEDDEVALLEPGRERVEVGEAGPHAADLAAVGVQVVEPVVGVVEERLERAEAGVDALLADREQLRLGAVDRLLDLGRVLVADPGDPPGRPDQVAQDRLALDDPGVLGDVDRGRRLVRQARQVGAAADRLELVAALERLGDRDDVDRLAPLEQVEDRGVDPAVGLPVEVGRAQELGDLDDRVAVDEDGAEHRLLGLETLRRKTVDHAWRTPSAVGGADCPVAAADCRSTKPTRPTSPSTNFDPMCTRCGRLSGYPPTLRNRESARRAVEAKADGEQESERTSRCVSDRRSRQRTPRPSARRR